MAIQKKCKYIVKAEYENGEIWVLIRTWNDKDYKDFWEKEKPKGIKSLTIFPIADFDKADNTGRWWHIN